MKSRRLEIIKPYPGLQDDFDVLCVDTEFSDLPFPKESIFDWRQRVEILAVGLCALDDSIDPLAFYATREISKKISGKCSEFVKANVIPYLGACDISARFQDLSDIRREIAEITRGRSKVSGKGIAVASDWAGDLFLLSEVFPPRTTYVAVEGISNIQEVMFESLGSGFVRHNALHDSMAFRLAFLQYLGCT